MGTLNLLQFTGMLSSQPDIDGSSMEPWGSVDSLQTILVMLQVEVLIISISISMDCCSEAWHPFQAYETGINAKEVQTTVYSEIVTLTFQNTAYS